MVLDLLRALTTVIIQIPIVLFRHGPSAAVRSMYFPGGYSYRERDIFDYAVSGQLLIWTAAFLMVSCVYRYVLNPDQQNWFEHLVKYLDSKLDSNIPLTFMLGFFVSFVVGRWGSILNGIGWIDDASILFASYIRGGGESTRILRRNMVRYMVLCQALVLRDISMQVRKRFPTMDTLAASGLMTEEEMEILDEIKDPYSRYWAPIQWCVNLVYECKADGRIEDYYLMNKIVDEISKFRHGLAALLKYDWVPVPLVYPQIDLWLPITTMVQFIVYMGWMKVAEALLNPLGEDDDDLECNYVIDKNLITGMAIVDTMWKQSKTGYSMVEENLARIPQQKKDDFWGIDKIAPLYSIESAERSVHPLVGSASKINLVKNRHEIVMTPHKNKLSELSEEEQKNYLRRVCVSAHNARHLRQRTQERRNSPDTCLSRVRTRSNYPDKKKLRVTIRPFSEIPERFPGRSELQYIQFYENLRITVVKGTFGNGNWNPSWTNFAMIQLLRNNPRDPNNLLM
ncbi:Bestrophin [Ancylostoma ceylanicum]|uniref:Bestrophin homolog n=1 Tax=Ancylostoma ceylanicum TaxID=53326 RepID=A0A0D6LTN5_9BILA|nr:Bestrophin [Ancylostoma ceylanicum]